VSGGIAYEEVIRESRRILRVTKFYLIVFTGGAGRRGSFTGTFSFDITAAMPRSSCGSRRDRASIENQFYAGVYGAVSENH
jgi:hypothetical protein